MNRTHFEHAAIALAMQLVLVILFCIYLGCEHLGSVILTALPPIFYFFSREHAQQEKKLQKKYGSSTISCKITLEALNMLDWSTDAKLDFAFPLLSCILQTIIVALSCA